MAFEHDEFGRSQLIEVRQLEQETGKSIFTAGIGCRICEI